MKTYKIFLIFAMLFALASCEDFEVQDPNASFKVLHLLEDDTFEEATVFQAGEDVYFENTGTGEIFTLYTGDPGHDSSSKTYTDNNGVEKINTGFNLAHTREEAKFKYNYTTPGTYTVKVIAISDYDDGIVFKEDVATKEITIQ